MSSEFQYIEFGKTDIQILDGDRGKNYPKQEDFHDSGYCVFLSAKNVTSTGFSFNEVQYITEIKDKELRKGKLYRNDIVLTTRGTLGNVAFYDSLIDFDNLRINSGMVIIRSSLNWNPKYLYYVLSSDFFQSQIISLTSGSAVPQLPIRDINKIKLPYVTLDVQEKIASFMDAITLKIYSNNQINKTLEAMAQAIFKSWFVDFDPVRAKAEAKAEGLECEAINRAAMRVIASKTDAELVQMAKDSPAEYANLQTTASHFPNELVESELGMIPKGWEVSSLGVLCEKVESGGTPKRSESEYWEGDIPWLSSGETHNIIITETREKITQNGLENSSAKLWTMYTTIVAMYGATAGKVCFSTIELTANQACCGLIPKEEYEFFLFFTAKNLMSSLAGRASGSAQQNLNKSLVEGHECLLPNEILVKFFNRTASSLIEKWIFNLNQNKNLLELRDSLLPKLLSGEIEV